MSNTAIARKFSYSSAEIKTNGGFTAARSASKTALRKILSKQLPSNEFSRLLSSTNQDMTVVQLCALRNAIEVATIVGRGHAAGDKYKSHSEDMPSKENLIVYLANYGGIENKLAADIINICLHTGTSEKYHWFSSSNFRTNSAERLIGSIDRILNQKSLQAKLANDHQNNVAIEEKPFIINHIDLKAYYSRGSKISDNIATVEILKLIKEISVPTKQLNQIPIKLT